MSTPVTVAALVGAFVLGLALGVPLAIAVVKRRLKAQLTAAPQLPVALPITPATDALEATAKLKLSVPAVPESVAKAISTATSVLPKPPSHRAEFVITDAGERDDSVPAGERKEFKVARPQLEQLAKVAMVEAASLAHGVRSALSEENRAKIQYEIKRELIALRKTRKAEVKQALIEYRAKHRAPVQPESGEES